MFRRTRLSHEEYTGTLSHAFKRLAASRKTITYQSVAAEALNYTLWYLFVTGAGGLWVRQLCFMAAGVAMILMAHGVVGSLEWIFLEDESRAIGLETVMMLAFFVALWLLFFVCAGALQFLIYCIAAPFVVHPLQEDQRYLRHLEKLYRVYDKNHGDGEADEEADEEATDIRYVLVLTPPSTEDLPTMSGALPNPE